MNAVTKPAPEKLVFNQLGLPPFLLSRLEKIGYEAPSPIQAQTIPLLLEGHDLVGQAQTGTGKTAAFALPALAGLDANSKSPQVLVLTPTRELSIQVAEAFQTYATDMKRFSVLPVYGGQEYRVQLRALQRGPQVIVSTPGRLMDHMRRGNISLSELKFLVLDEADEMLRMGFIDDVQWILDQTPKERQIALFSATMPAPIKRIAKQHLTNPKNVEIKGKTNVATTINQRYLPVQGRHKLDAVTRLLETEEVDAAIIFVRTKVATAELADKLSARGMRCSALNGEMRQTLREQTIDRLRKGKLDILIATDVAARGLDVKRISHVINYDIPYDTESYVHRIGRTGRAGRAGDAILFVAPREQRMLALIEQATGASIKKMKLPTAEDISKQRAQRVADKITSTLSEADLSHHRATIEQYLGEHEVRSIDIAAALAYLYQETQNQAPLTDIPEATERSPRSRNDRFDSDRGSQRGNHRNRSDRDDRSERRPPRRQDMPVLEEGMERYKLEVGQDHGAVPGMIVGAIANEGGIDSQYMGRISIQNDFSLIDLPEGMPKSVFKDLKKTRVCGRPLRISRVDPNGKPESDASEASSGKNKKRTVERPGHKKSDRKNVAKNAKGKNAKAKKKRHKKRPTAA